MNPELDKLSSYIEAIPYADRVSAVPGRSPFITISRQAGINGRAFAEDLLRAMRERPQPLFKDWTVFDDALCRQATVEPRFRAWFESLRDERYLSAVDDYVSQFVAATAPQRTVVRHLFETVRRVALVGKAVLIGRGGMMAARDLDGGIHIRLVAPKERRVRDYARRFEVSLKEAALRVEEKDASRARLIKLYCRRDIEDPLLYHYVLNVGLVPPREASALLLEAIRLRADSLKRAA